MFKIICLLTACFFAQGIYAQQLQYPSCGQKEATEQLFKRYPEIKKRHEQIEKLLAAYKKNKNFSTQRNRNIENTVTLPVVIHIIHHNGAENISDATVMQGFKHLNEAFANAGYYTSVNGTDTHIQFCMAERDPDGNATNGITRNVSAYTNMGGSEYYSNDLDVKNLNRWNPDEYINVWLVNSIPGDVVGYAYLPSAAGTNVDGIVMEAAYFGSSASNDVVITHEIGHYLGLYHTFDGGCTNNDCITDGDKVCDTPPDQSTAGVSCNINMNTCTTDVLSGFNSDQYDLKEDFMDYGNFECIKLFTPGQAERMNWFVQNVRYSLLSAKSCLPPCTAKVNAIFSSSAKNVLAGTPVNFTNKSSNANSYKWYVDGTLQSASVNYTYTFTTAGMHIVKLLAQSNDALCDDDIALDTIMVTCAVKADFTFTTGVIKANDAVNFTNTSTNASAYTWKIDGIIKGNSFNFSYAFPLPGVYTVTLIAAGNICSDSISKKVSVYDSTGVIPAEKCTITTFQKNYFNNSELIWDLRPTKDSGYIMSGMYSIPLETSGEAFAAKLDKSGAVQWSKYIEDSNFLDTRIFKIKETREGNFIGTGIFYNTVSNNLISKALLVKLDAKGDIVWQKKFGVSGSNGENGRDVTETKDGGYAFCGSDNDNDWNTTNWLVAKTDAAGNIVWSKKYDNGFYERAYGIIANEDTLIVCGIRTIPTGPRSQIVVTKLNAKDGSVIQSRVFDVANRSVETTSVFKTPGGYLVSAHSIADGFYYADMDLAILQLDENLNVVKAGKINADIFASVHAGISPTPDGGFIAMQEGPNWSVTGDTTKLMIYKINAQWQLDWTKQFPLTSELGQLDFAPNAIFPTADNGYIFGETTYRSGEYVEHLRIIKTDDKGNTPGCIVDTFKADFITPAVTENNFNWSATGNVIFNDPPNPSLNLLIKNAPLAEEQRCSTSNCDSLKIIGQDSVCNIQDTIIYKAYRNPSCASPVEWIVDTEFARIISKTDSSVYLKFYKTGNSKISARILSACKVLQDDMNIYINDVPATLNLGDDIQLCKSSTVKLSAGSGFKKYMWNDGSVDSTLTAYNTGKYYVTATDYCGNYFSDTINITQAPEITLNVAHDLKRCDNDTVEIAAPAGFQNYIWSPHYNISSTSGNIVKVWPDVDTTYLLTVQISNACTVIDTAHVQTSLKSLPLEIGNDTSFCSGDYITLKAPSGFKQYTWQDGSTGQSLQASTKGVYSLQASNGNGCISKDTMEIKDVYALPNIDLGKDGAFCMNNDHTLYAGESFTSYLWQDGSTQKTLPVNKPGKYWVSVTDNNNCSNSDTINITGLIPEPQGFLTKQIEICNHEKTELKASGNWQSYLWNDNTTMPYLVVSSAGKYWLKVKDVNGCSGQDTTEVLLKPNCKNIIHFPSAFTPDNDGKNDVFKPTAFAPLEMYKLVIYNRWGRKIYESDNVAKGWNGIYNNGAAETGTYIWQAIYKFYDEPQKTEKGTVVLIK